ncbi:MAG: hypothetical protein WA741_20940 [Candidatus Sulfotelmatobacter sp.]
MAITAENNSETRAFEDALRAAVRQSPRSFESNHRLGEFYFHLQRYRESISPLVAAYQLNPRDRQSAFDLALADKFGGEFLRAREQVEQMLKEGDLSKQDEANLRRLLGDLDETLGDPLGGGERGRTRCQPGWK